MGPEPTDRRDNGVEKAPTCARQGAASSSRRGLVVTLTLGVAAVCLLGYYGPQIRGVFVLQPWDRAGPAALLDSFAQSVRAHDAAAVERLAPKTEVDSNFETMLTPRAKPRQPALPPEEQLPAGPAATAERQYDYELGVVKLSAETAEGRIYTYTVGKQDGAWVLLEWSPTPRRRR